MTETSPDSSPTYRILFLRSGGRYADLGPPDCPMISAGRADILVMAPTSSEPDFAGLAARCPSGSACLVGDRMVVL
jgi:hypothetical protein